MFFKFSIKLAKNAQALSGSGTVTKCQHFLTLQ